jgi:quercetin dioxygenase-like cupin family protein
MSKAVFGRWEDMTQTEMTPQIRRRVVSGENLMSVEFHFDKGAIIATHHHVHEQISHIISGRIEFTVGDETQIMKAGDVLYIPSNVPHSAVILEDTVNLEIFSPPREDFLTAELPDYMR